MNLRKLVRISTLILVLLAAGAASAYAEWRHFGGLPGAEAIAEDQSGMLWFGTGAGAIRYDGVTWETFTTEDGLVHDQIRAVVVDASGNLWFGTRGGVSRYNVDGWTSFTEDDGLVSNDVRAVCEDSSGDLWFGTAQGVSRFDGAGWTTYTTDDGLVHSSVWAIFEDSSGDLWFGTGNGVSRYNETGWLSYSEADGRAIGWVLSIAEDRSGNMWFGGNTTPIYRFDGVNWSVYTKADGLPRDFEMWSAILQDSSGNLWFAGWYGGLTRFDGVNWRTYTAAEGLGSSVVFAIYQDSVGNLWFGVNGGVTRYDGVDWTTYTEADGLVHHVVNDIYKDTSGALWIGTTAGVSRYDGVNWTMYTTDDGLIQNYVVAICEDSSGNMWFGSGYGVSRFDGTNWTTFTTQDGLVGNAVREIVLDSAGNLWFGANGGVSRYDGVGWTNFTEADGLVHFSVWAVCEGSSGDMWFGTSKGVSRYDGAGWTTYTTADGLADDHVETIFEDKSGDIWFGNIGVSRYDGENWTTYTTADGVGAGLVVEIYQDSRGDMWIGSGLVLSHYDGLFWKTYDVTDGLGGTIVEAIVEDDSGKLWFGTASGLTAHVPDRVPPQTVIWPKPPRLSPNTIQNIGFAAAYGESRPMRFSYSVDGSPWSAWSEEASWLGTGILDGVHTFAVMARDEMGNIDTSAAVCTFEVDATAPSPVISDFVRPAPPRDGYLPTAGLQDSVLVIGTADDPRFRMYRLQVRAVNAPSWTNLAESWIPVDGGVLGQWNTLSVPDGEYELRLSETDTLGLTGVVTKKVDVDNYPPWLRETSPATVNAAVGGSVYTTEGDAHLYIPPHAFSSDSEVSIDELSDGQVPDTLAGGAARVFLGYEISWEQSMNKAAALELSLPDSVMAEREGSLVLYMKGGPYLGWRRLGGTLDGSAKTISVPVTHPGLYSLFEESVVMVGSGGLSRLSITPRVFSPGGGFAASRASIGFTLGRSGSVTVKIYNRAGRLVRVVTSGEQLSAGDNLFHWDGRGREGDLVEDGIYMVTVEALGQKQVKPLAVVR